MSSVFRIQHDIPAKLIIRLMLIFLGVILILRVSEFAVYVIAGLVLYTLIQKRVEFAFFALMLLVSLAIMNPVFFTKGTAFYTITRGSLFFLAVAMGLRSAMERSAWFLSPFLWLYAYMGVIMVTSLAGWAPVISELKAVLFLAFIFALIQGVSAVVQSGVDITLVRAAMLVVACFFILGSVVSIFIPSVGRSMILGKMEIWGDAFVDANMAGLFNGVTWHSQTLGPVVAMLNAFLLSDYLCNIRKRSYLYWLLLGSVPILVYLTSSRTALFAYLLSLAATLYFLMRARRVSASKKNRVVLTVVFLGFVTSAVLILRPGGMAHVEAFLRKAQDVEQMDTGVGLAESLTQSRKGLVEYGLENFRESPLIGNGFQVSKQMQAYDLTETGLILSAPIEKGVLPIMVLEEGGVVGALLFASFVIAAYTKYQRLQFTCFLSTFTVFLGLNSGEATFFSTSGGGGILWMICFCALLMDIHRHRRSLAQRAQLMMLPMR